MQHIWILHSLKSQKPFVSLRRHRSAGSTHCMHIVHGEQGTLGAIFRSDRCLGRGCHVSSQFEMRSSSLIGSRMCLEIEEGCVYGIRIRDSGSKVSVHGPIPPPVRTSGTTTRQATRQAHIRAGGGYSCRIVETGGWAWAIGVEAWPSVPSMISDYQRPSRHDPGCCSA